MMSNAIRRIAATAVLLIAGLTGQASASIVIYTSEADFTAATTGLTNVDFNGIADPGTFVGFGSGPLVLSGVTFTSNSSMYVIDPAYYGSSYAGGGFLTSDYASVNTLVAALPGAYTAIGTNFGGLFGPVDFTITLSDGSVFTASSPSSITGTNSLDFIGVTSTIALTSITFDMPDAGSYNAIDNFRFGDARSVPEPSSLISIALGGLTAIGYGLRRRKAQATA